MLCDCFRESGSLRRNSSPIIPAKSGIMVIGTTLLPLEAQVNNQIHRRVNPSHFFQLFSMESLL